MPKNVLNDTNASEYQYRSWFVNLLMEELFLDLVKLNGEIDNEQRKMQRELTAPQKDCSGG
ncbi:2524_t:CDS:2, partial [Entrophospora sp. SA101]